MGSHLSPLPQELSKNSPPGPGGFLGVFGALAWGPFGGPLPALLLLQRPQNWLGGAGGVACGGIYGGHQGAPEELGGEGGVLGTKWGGTGEDLGVNGGH